MSERWPTDTVQVGVIGTGAMGAAHVDNLAHVVPGARVTQVFDVDSERAKVVADQVGATAAPSAESLLESAHVDAVLIAAPDPWHEPLAVACIELGKPTLLEKPIAADLEGGRRVVEAEVRAGRRLVQLGFMRRFDPEYGALRAGVLGGSVGRVRAAHCVHRNPHSHPSHTDESVLFGSMVHEFDIVPWLLDDPLVAVTVFAGRVADGRLKDLQVAALETEGGSVVTVEVYVNAGYGYDIRTEVVGSERTLTLGSPHDVAGAVVDQDCTERFLEAYRLEVGAWVDGIRAGRLTGPTAWDGHRANVAAFAAVASLHGAGRVEIASEQPPALYC